MFAFTTFIQYSDKSYTWTIRQEKVIKDIQIGKEEVGFCLFTWSYVENPNISTRKLLKLVNKFKVAGYNINIQKSAVFCTLAMNYLKKIKKTIQFTMASKR